MQISLSTYRPATGWHPPLPVALDSPTTLVLAFGAGSFVEDAAPFFALADAFPRSVHAGCSSGAESSGDGLEHDHIAVAVVRFDTTWLQAATVTVRRRPDSATMGAALAAQLPPEGLRMVLLLSESQGVDGDALLRGLRGGLPRSTQIAGGLAGDRGATATPWVYGADGRLPAPGQACAVGLYGTALRIGQGHAGGWQAWGDAHRVTRHHANVLYELDGLPALAVYRSRLGAAAERLPAAALRHPLAVSDGRGGAPSIRCVLSVDEARGALVLGGTLPEACAVRVMRAEVDALQLSTARALQEALAALPAGDSRLLLSIGCLGRQLAMAEAGGSLPGRPPSAIGFYSFGELGPGRHAGEVLLHHQTHAFTALAEA